MASRTPASPSLSSTWSSRGRPATGTSGFGIRSVNGRMRKPRPAARTMALVGLTDIWKISVVSQPLSIARRFGQDRCMEAIVAADDGCTTAGQVRKSGVRAGAPGMFLLLAVAVLQEGDADLVAIDPGQLTAAIGKPG